MIVLIDDNSDVFALVEDDDVDAIEAACRAEFWRRECEYQAPPNTENPPYVWAGLDLTGEHWTIWCREEGQSWLDARIAWLEGHVEEVTPWPSSSPR